MQLPWHLHCPPARPGLRDRGGGRPANPAQEALAGWKLKGHREKLSEPVNFVHGSAGFIPGLGAIPDLIDAGVYALEGDAVSATLSLGAAVPFAGDAAKAATAFGKAGKQVAKDATGKTS